MGHLPFNKGYDLQNGIQRGAMGLDAAGAIVGEYASRGVVDVAVLPFFVRHPEVFDDLGTAREVLLEDLAIEEALLGNGLNVSVLNSFLFKLLVGIEGLGEGFEVLDGAVTHGVGEGSLFAIENAVGEIVALETLAEEAFAHARFVEFHLGVDAHDVADEVKVAKGYAGLEAVAAYATVGTEDVIHIEFVDTLNGFLLEGFGAGSIVGILVAEEFVANLASEEDLDVGFLTYVLTNHVHAN